ncbi:MAG: transposase, partial [Thermoplasmata archaeon]
MKVKRTEQIQICENDELRKLTHLSKNLYNKANYIIRQEFFHNKWWIRYNDLDKIMNSSKNYRSLPAATSQQILRLLDRSWNSFFRSIKKWKKRSEKFIEIPKLPKYKKKDSEHILIFIN